ncbi:MAG: ABC transporter ATP-binding protein, partial [Firmicutes bacterium]|nr:ABC transporter ATP-binding protein [Bacillota bacterium]
MIHQNIQQQNSTQQKRPHSKRYILRLFADNPRVIPVFIGVAIILFVGVMLSLQMPFLVGEAADIIAGTASGDLRRLIILLAVLYSIIALLHVVEEVCINNMMTRMVTRGYRLRISKKIRELDVSFVDNHPHGDILSRTMDDVSNFGGSGTGTLIRQGVGSLVFIFGIGIGLFGLNPFLPLVVFGVVILTIVLGGIFTGAIGKYFSQLQERVGDLNAHITESFSAHDVIKAYNLQGHSISQFEGLNRRLRNTAYKAFSLVAWGWPIMTLLNTISFIAVGIFGAFLAINGYVTPGEILTILMLTQMLNAPMLGIVQLLIELQRAKASGKRIYDILDADEMLDFADSFGGEVVVAGGASVGSSAVVGSAVG